MLRNVKNIALERLSIFIKSYEDVIGLSEVKLAQQRVLSAEKTFSETQELRRNAQTEMQDVNIQLKEIQLELDKTSRVEDRYLQLVTKEHSIIKEERKLQEQLKGFEKEEREKFASLTNAVRQSHEKERSYSEKTKYWSVIGSVAGATVGILGTAYNNKRRLKELRNIVVESTMASSNTIQEIRTILGETSADSLRQEQIVTSLINKLTAGRQLPLYSKHAERGLFLVDDKICKQLDEIKSYLVDQRQASSNEIIASDNDYSGSGIYIKRDLERVIKDTEARLHKQMQVNSAVTIAMIYGALAVSIVIAFKFFSS